MFEVRKRSHVAYNNRQFSNLARDFGGLELTQHEHFLDPTPIRRGSFGPPFCYHCADPRWRSRSKTLTDQRRVSIPLAIAGAHLCADGYKAIGQSNVPANVGEASNAIALQIGAEFVT